jgi:PLP dependent protein
VIDPAALLARLADVRERIARAADRVGRDPSSIRLVAVSKTFSPDHVRIAADAGQIDFGENKVQEGLEKIAQVGLPHLRWHLIGHLQSNKARKAIGFHAVHSIDSASLLQKLDAACGEHNRTPHALVQVDLALEPNKHGATSDDLGPIFAAARACTAVRVGGLMMLPPAVDDPEQARPWFRRLRAVRADLVEHGIPASMLGDLSMGMSHDYEVAVEEGATIVRVGSAIFGERN